MTSRQPLVRPLLLACLLAIGVGVVLAMAVLYLVDMGESVGPHRPRVALEFRFDGTPLLSYSTTGFRAQAVRTLDGAEIPGDERIRRMHGAWLPVPRPEQASAFTLDWHERITAFAEDRRPAIYWYVVHDGQLEGNAYFVGYDSVGKSCVGYIGAAGYRSEEPPKSEWLPMDGRLMANRGALGDNDFSGAREPRYGNEHRTVPVLSGDRLLEIDFRHRSVTTLLELPGAIAFGSLSHPLYPPPKDLPEDRQEEFIAWEVFWAIRTADRVVLHPPKTRFARPIQPKPSIERSYRLPQELHERGFTFYEIRPGSALVDAGRSVPEGVEHDLFWIDAEGRILRHEQVLLEGPWLMANPRVAAWVMACAIPSPVGAAGGIPYAWVRSGVERDTAGAIRRALAESWAPWAMTVLVGGVAAWLCYRHQRRFDQPHTPIWVIFVLLGGVPGLVGYLWCRRWPVLQPCPHCERPSPRDRDRCCHCDAEFPAPAPQGIEVFA